MATRPAPPVERLLLGIGLRILMALVFSLMGALLKAASLRGAAVPELLFYRSLGAFPVVAGWVFAREGLAGIATRQPLAHMTRSAIGIVSMSLTFLALSLLPLAEATTLAYSAAISATILSALVLREKIGLRRWAAVLVGFVGVLLVARPGVGMALPALGIAAGLGAAMGQAAVMITIRQISRTETTSAIVFWFTTITLFAAGLAMPFYGSMHPPMVMAMLIGAGVMGGIGQLAMTGSLRFAPVSAVVPFDYLQIIGATLLGWYFFATPTPPTLFAGAVLIAVSGIYTAARERQRGRVPNEAMAAPEP